jgi:ATP-dependent Lon protease
MRIGGLKEKTMAAMRAGVRTVIIPAENEPDLEDIDQTVRDGLNFISADHIDGILEVALDFSAVRLIAARSGGREDGAMRMIISDKSGRPEGVAGMRQ